MFKTVEHFLGGKSEANLCKIFHYFVFFFAFFGHSYGFLFILSCWRLLYTIHAYLHELMRRLTSISGIRAFHEILAARRKLLRRNAAHALLRSVIISYRWFWIVRLLVLSNSGIGVLIIIKLPILRGVSHCQTPLFGKRGGGSGGGALSGWAGAMEERSDPAAKTTVWQID